MRNAQKTGHFNRKAEEQDGLEKWDFPPESGNDDTYHVEEGTHNIISSNVAAQDSVTIRYSIYHISFASSLGHLVGCTIVNRCK